MPGNTAPSPRSRNTTILFTTIVSLLLIFSYYMFVYVPSHEETMHEQHIRVLNKIAQNIKTKLGSTISNARRIAEHTASVNGDMVTLAELKKNAGYFNSSIQFQPEGRLPMTSTNNQQASEREAGPDSTLQIYVMEQQYGEQAIHVVDYFSNENGNRIKYHFSISAEDLTANLLRFDHYEKFALFTADKVLFETHPTGSRIKVPFDTLLNADSQISTSYFREIRYGGLPYMAYFRPLRIADDQQWMLAGFIDMEKIAMQKYSLSPLFSIIMLLFIVVTFLCIPFIKIQIMHVREHLTLREVAFSFMSVTFVLSTLTLLVLMGYTYWDIDKRGIEQELKTLSKSIKTNLREETGAVLDVLAEQELLEQLPDTADLYEVQKRSPSKLSLTSIENVFFVDNEGDQDQSKKTISNISTPVINIANRRYYQQAKASDLLCDRGFKDPKRETCFYLESIISYNTGKQLAALSISTLNSSVSKDFTFENLPVLAATGRFHSIIKTVLPFGYGFAVLNDSGEVLFHSDSNRNLQENFFDELQASAGLEANIFGRTTDLIKTKYHDRSTLLYVSPVDGWPVSLVTFYDSSLLSLKYLELFTLFMTVYVLAIGGLLLVFVLGYVIEKWGTTFWEKANQEPIFSLKQLAPQKRNQYKYSAVLACYSVLFIIFLPWALLEQPGISVLICVFLLCMIYWILRYFFSDQESNGFWLARVFEVLAVTGGMVIYMLSEFEVELNRWRLLYLLVPLSVLVLFVLGWVFHCSSTYRIHDVSRTVQRWCLALPFARSSTYLHSYYRSIFLGALALGLLLTCAIYGACYVQETEALQKYGLVQFSRTAAQHETEERAYIQSLYRGDERPPDYLLELGRQRITECRGIYMGRMHSTNKTGPDTASSHLFYPNPYQLETGTSISKAHIYNSPDSLQQVLWDYTSDSLYLNVEQKLDHPNLSQPMLSVERASLTNISGAYLFLMLVFIFLLAGTGYAMVRQIVRQLFILRTPEKYKFQSKEFADNLQSFKELTAERDKHIYLVTVPVQFRHIFKKIDRDDFELVSWEDLQSGSVQLNPQYFAEYEKSLLVSEFDVSEHADNVGAIQMLKKVMQHTAVILVSNIDPLDLLKRTKERPAEDALKQHDALADLLAEFETYYFPLTDDTIRQYQVEKQNEDLLVIEQNIYYELWNSLTSDEQYVLHDLTHDGLVNTQNLPIIHRLYKKGLISDHDNTFETRGDNYISSLHIFNNRFSDFIDKLATKENLKELEEEINATGTWHQYRTPLLITLTGILVFVFITQQETYGEVVSVLGSIAASLPLVLRLMNSFFTGRNTAEAS